MQVLQYNPTSREGSDCVVLLAPHSYFCPPPTHLLSSSQFHFIPLSLMKGSFQLVLKLSSAFHRTASGVGQVALYSAHSTCVDLGARLLWHEIKG